jgi:hypothetical protein
MEKWRNILQNILDKWSLIQPPTNFKMTPKTKQYLNNNKKQYKMKPKALVGAINTRIFHYQTEMQLHKVFKQDSTK